MCVLRWFGALEVNVVDSVVGVTRACWCGVGASQTYFFVGEGCRETVVTKLADGDQVAVTQGW